MPSPLASVVPFPTLSFFAIYTTAPGHPDEDELHDDAAVEASKLLLFYTSPTSDEPSKERKARLMGTVMGMADFARMLSSDGGPSVRSVQSQLKRMIYIEPEKGIFVHATINLPQRTSGLRHTRGLSTESQNNPGASSGAYLEDAALLKALENGYEEYRLFNGNIGSRLTREKKDLLTFKLSEFWLPWLARWNLGKAGSVASVIGGLLKSTRTIHNSANLNPITAQFEASNPQATPILLRGSKIIYIPSALLTSSLPKLSKSPILTEIDIATLTRHVIHKLQTSVGRIVSAGKLSRKPSENFDKPSKGYSKWDTYTLGMGAYLTNPSLPNVPRLPSLASLSIPVMSMPSLAMPSMPSLSISKPTESQIEGSSSGASKDTFPTPWGLKNWTGLSKGSQRSSNRTSKAVASESFATGETATRSQDDSIARTLSNSTQVNDQLPPLASSSVVESEVIAEANLGGTSEASSITTPPLIEPEIPSSLSSPDENSIFCGQPYSLEVEAQYHIIQRGLLSLILVCFRDEVPDRLFGNANRLLEAVESIVEHSDPISPGSPHRHLVKTGALITSQVWPNRDRLWSGQSSDQLEIESALFDAHRNITSSPPIYETLNRTNANQWVLASNSQETSDRDKKEVYVVVPGKVGKDGSLIDAGEELRKVSNI